MKQAILDELKRVTPEEEQALLGTTEINATLYQQDLSSKAPGTIFDSKKLLESGKLITIRKHTRFLHFPQHSHNYVEIIYMCTGSTRHIINGNEIILNQGELLFLNQNALQEIYPAGNDDIAVNFIILPEFFDYALNMLEDDKNPLRSFIIDCMRGEKKSSAYLHYRVSDVLPVQNLVENLIWTLMNHQQNKRSINQATMGLLFLQLANYADAAETDATNDSDLLMTQVLNFIEEHYKDGSLIQLADQLHYNVYFLSREIKRSTGLNFTDLIQNKRLKQASYLLLHTSMSVADISGAVGYENISYFHRIFKKHFGVSPRHYRINGDIIENEETQPR